MKKRVMIQFFIEKWGDEEKPLAIFLGEYERNNKQIVCYSTIGQHGTVVKEYIDNCRPAKYSEYKWLLMELAQRYTIDIITDEIVGVGRKPTIDEIKKGYGAAHFLDVNISKIIKKDGSLKNRFLNNDDKLFYSR
jgi:hypothetical protein